MCSEVGEEEEEEEEDEEEERGGSCCKLRTSQIISNRWNARVRGRPLRSTNSL